MSHHLIYIADPMCSWCYGFGPELAKFEQLEPETHIDILLGGLRAYHDEPADQAFKETIRGHWTKVRDVTGLPFNDAALEHENFVYDTEPACRAVVTVRDTTPELALPYFHAIQRAFYAEGRNVTQDHVLADIAAETGIDRERFLELWRSPEMREQTEHDFALVSRWGVRGFPAIVAAHDDRLTLVASGYTPADKVVAALSQLDSISL
ncbi:MAG TPA: DsbA family protein [Burkholderiaceae bacterium]|nr:DsbA family protein [Burkholderiaceae bacterium]